jgi:hypothetical protein
MNRPTSSLPRALRAAALLAALAPSAASAHSAASALPVCTAGETVLRVGDPRLASFIPPAADTVDMWMQRDTTLRPMGVFTQHVRRVEHDGGPAWMIVQHSQMGPRMLLDSITVRAGTFAPLRHVADTPAHDVNVRFAGGRATGTVVDSAHTKQVDDAVSAAAFDHSMASILLRAIPLCEGLKIRAETYDVTSGAKGFSATVLGREQVEFRGRTWDAWAVEVEAGAARPRLYFDPATGREVGWVLSYPDGRTSMRGATRIHGGGGGGGHHREMQMRIIDFD